MAELPQADVIFEGCCPDCGTRHAVLPAPLPGIENDFDWAARDFDSFRLFMMQELAHRFPARKKWTSADMEVVLVELLSAALDRASHDLDVVQTERYLDSARRPESVRRLLKLIGYVAEDRIDPDEIGIANPTPEQVETYWRNNVAAMDAARVLGPRLTGEQQRMVTLSDHETMLASHPLVARTRAKLLHSGAWNTIMISVLLRGDRSLDKTITVGGVPPANDPNYITDDLWKTIVKFHRSLRLEIPAVDASLTARRLLQTMIERYRMVGSEVFLDEAKHAPVTFTFAVRAKRGYFRSELKQAIDAVLTSDEGGFFEPGRLGFGEYLYASDLIAAIVAVEGVEAACLNRFKRVGSAWPDRTADEFISVADDELILCMNHPIDPTLGTYRLIIDGGELA